MKANYDEYCDKYLRKDSLWRLERTKSRGVGVFATKRLRIRQNIKLYGIWSTPITKAKAKRTTCPYICKISQKRRIILGPIAFCNWACHKHANIVPQTYGGKGYWQTASVCKIIQANEELTIDYFSGKKKNGLNKTIKGWECGKCREENNNNDNDNDNEDEDDENDNDNDDDDDDDDDNDDYADANNSDEDEEETDPKDEDYNEMSHTIGLKRTYETRSFCRSKKQKEI